MSSNHSDDGDQLNNGHVASSTPQGQAKVARSGAEDEEEVFEFEGDGESPDELAQMRLNTQVMNQLEDMVRQ